MDGTLAHVPTLAALAERSQSALMIDDAHGFGLPYAAASRGHQPQSDIYIATLGKAIGCAGAFVTGSEELIDYLTSFARTFGFSTALPPVIAAAALAAVDYIESNPSHAHVLTQHIHDFGVAMTDQGWLTCPSQTAIVPLVIGDEAQTLALADQLKQRGIWATAIRPPTVKPGTCRIRITLSSAHTQAHIEQLITILGQLKRVNAHNLGDLR